MMMMMVMMNKKEERLDVFSAVDLEEFELSLAGGRRPSLLLRRRRAVGRLRDRIPGRIRRPAQFLFSSSIAAGNTAALPILLRPNLLRGLHSRSEFLIPRRDLAGFLIPRRSLAGFSISRGNRAGFSISRRDSAGFGNSRRDLGGFLGFRRELPEV
ncbi:unnamed protein product [Cuscuta campestris]|uniref:Uncharacterized protein n=1 Tax=Cuscuta campestris TaxID=132261 RepID=A0A484MUJ2_9ASTE|nr:unnamed protein product [Cuscuta campestris]